MMLHIILEGILLQMEIKMEAIFTVLSYYIERIITTIEKKLYAMKCKI